MYMNSIYKDTRQYFNSTITNNHRYYRHITLSDNTDNKTKHIGMHKIFYFEWNLVQCHKQ